ncbi:efflux RND transporter periplasmic adaptor subunit [Tenacibaculum geojense]|uniref:Efflux RND transporter periplasmic adaptor subunit n=1 Tax=Tenacibaculum geojense TaxID=915352 RepID=A0ABW3JSB8_9FLAO
MFLLASCAKETTSDSKNTIPPVKVTVAKAQNNSSGFIQASGKVYAVNNATLSTRMMGFVREVPVKVGDKVVKGQQLISIQSADIEAKAAQVKAGISEATVAYNNAKRDYDRYRKLFAEKSVSVKEMDDISAMFNMAKARLDAVKQQQKEVNAQFLYSNLKAPFSGVITQIFIKKGDMANPGVPLIAMENPATYEVKTRVSESAISQLTKGNKATVEINAIGAKLNGTITEISTSTQYTGGQYMVTVLLDENKAKLYSGMFASVNFSSDKTEEVTNSILIPHKAIVTKGQLKGVYTVSSQGTAILRWLRLGKTNDAYVEVLSGLKADETYILTAESKLYNGVPVSVQ